MIMMMMMLMMLMMLMMTMMRKVILVLPYDHKYGEHRILHKTARQS